MSADQQGAPAKPSAKATTSNEKVASQAAPAAPASAVREKSGFEIHRDRMRDRQGAIDHHRESVLAGIAKLNASLEKVPEAEVNKRLTIRTKIKSFEDQLDIIAQEQAELDSQQEAIARQEQEDRVEEAARTRQQLQKDGRSVADVIRHTLGLLEKQFGQWKELKERERNAMDILRSMAPSRMTNLPYFSFATGIDQNFEVVIGQVIRELHRAQADIYARKHATEIQQKNAAALVEAAQADMARREAQNEELKKKATTR